MRHAVYQNGKLAGYLNGTSKKVEAQYLAGKREQVVVFNINEDAKDADIWAAARNRMLLDHGHSIVSKWRVVWN